MKLGCFSFPNITAEAMPSMEGKRMYAMLRPKTK